MESSESLTFYGTVEYLLGPKTEFYQLAAGPPRTVAQAPNLVFGYYGSSWGLTT